MDTLIGLLFAAGSWGVVVFGLLCFWRKRRNMLPLFVASLIVCVSMVGMGVVEDGKTAESPAPSASVSAPAAESPSAEPTPTPEPTPTQEPEPTPTPEPSVGPEPTLTPTPSPEPKPSPVPTPTPEPTPEPVPTPTPEPTPEPTPTPEPSVEPTPSIDPQQAFRDSLAQYNYVGSSQSDRYHKPTCRWTSEIYDYNLVHFDTVEEAQAAGYQPCKVCHPQ